MKKLLAVGVIVLFLGLAIAPSTGTIDVKQITLPTNSGDTLYVGGNGTGNYTSIQGAIDDASGGDTVFVYDDSSPYYENIVMNKSINLVGENRDTTVIDGCGSDDVVHIYSSKVTVSGFTIQKSGDRFFDAGINLMNSYDTVITDNHISNNECGIRLYDSPYNSITGNTIILNNWSGIYICDLSYTVNISGNYISSNNGNGICIGVESMDITITNNTINSNNVTGIVILSYWGHNIINNNISNNNQGILLYARDSNIIKNNFIGNRRHAYFRITFFGRNHWDSNYWDNWIGIGPKLIFGRNGYLWGFLPWINFDWRPAQEPYDIGV